MVATRFNIPDSKHKEFEMQARNELNYQASKDAIETRIIDLK